jgi:hypothetical protein
MKPIPSLALVLVAFLTVEVAVEAALTFDAPSLILIHGVALPLYLRCAASLLLGLLSLHIAKEGSLPRRVIESGGACLAAAGLLRGHGQVLRARFLVPTLPVVAVMVGVQDCCTTDSH